MSNNLEQSSIRKVQFLLAIALQLGLLGALFVPKLEARLVGQEVVLRAEPQDPYHILSGHYVNLRYNLGHPANIERNVKLMHELQGEVSDLYAYALLEKHKDGVWHAVSVTFERPVPNAHQVVLRGEHKRTHIKYGIEWFFTNEKTAKYLEKALRENPKGVYAVVRIDQDGKGALKAMRVGTQEFK